jgi:hypothetical protein
MQVIGAGVGRTGTYSLKAALESLGFGPCHHMKVVIEDMERHVPLWENVLRGEVDWGSVYAGHQAAVDWPTATFFRELHGAYPNARFILGYRDPRTWVESFSETIFTALAGKDAAPPEVQPWMEMCLQVIKQAGFELGMTPDELEASFIAHNEAVQSAIPAEQLLIFDVKEGWQPLCEFLGVPVPAGDLPRSNSRTEFWDLVEVGNE